MALLTSKAERRAVMMAQFSRWQSRDLARSIAANRPQAPLYTVPRHLRPMSMAKAAGSLEAAAKDVGDRAVARTCRSVFCALGHSGEDHHLQRILTAHEGQAAHRLPSCMQQSEKVVRGAAPKKPTITKHDTVARFDIKTMVTSVTTTATIVGATNDLWGLLVRQADPRTWDDARSTNPNDFFKLSERIKGRDDKLGGWVGQLHEVFEWNWNTDNAASYDNILDIEHIVANDRVEMRYWLSECISTDLLVVRQPGGLDVDDGHYTLHRKGPKGQTIEIEAVKNVRYTEPEIGPDGFVMLMNFMTPALLYTWLDQAVFQTLSEAVDHGLAHPPILTPRLAVPAGIKYAAADTRQTKGSSSHV